MGRDNPGVVYRLKCNDCEQAYVSERASTASERVKEHATYVRIGTFDM